MPDCCEHHNFIGDTLAVGPAFDHGEEQVGQLCEREGISDKAVAVKLYCDSTSIYICRRYLFLDRIATAVLGFSSYIEHTINCYLRVSGISLTSSDTN